MYPWHFIGPHFRNILNIMKFNLCCMLYLKTVHPLLWTLIVYSQKSEDANVHVSCIFYIHWSFVFKVMKMAIKVFISYWIHAHEKIKIKFVINGRTMLVSGLSLLTIISSVAAQVIKLFLPNIWLFHRIRTSASNMWGSGPNLNEPPL